MLFASDEGGVPTVAAPMRDAPESRVVFFGTGEFAASILSALGAANELMVVGVVTQPDRPSGRGQRVSETVVKRTARALDLPVFQPLRLKSSTFISAMEGLQPDYLIVADYGRILPRAILKVAKIAPINVHPSLLPRWRGASPIQRTLLAGETITGVTTICMSEEMDAGDILLQTDVPVDSEEDCGALAQRLAEIGGDLAIRTARLLSIGEVQPTPQFEEDATYAPPIRSDETILRWSEGPIRCRNQVRAFSPKPGAFCCFNGRRIKALDLQIGGSCEDGLPPGMITAVTPDGVFVAAGSGIAILRRVLPAGGREMEASAWARGARIVRGLRFDPITPEERG